VKKKTEGRKWWRGGKGTQDERKGGRSLFCYGISLHRKGRGGNGTETQAIPCFRIGMKQNHERDECIKKKKKGDSDCKKKKILRKADDPWDAPALSLYRGTERHALKTCKGDKKKEGEVFMRVGLLNARKKKRGASRRSPQHL